VKNRDVWRCPSAKLFAGARVILPGPDWFNYLKSYEGSWGEVADYAMQICQYTYPPGWGGEVTDSFAQMRYALPEYGIGSIANKAFVQSIDVGWNADMKMASVQDAAGFLIVFEKGGVGGGTSDVGNFCYPDICQLQCSNSNCGWADWVVCASSGADCGLYNMAPNNGAFMTNPELRKPYARHLGGVNVGFLDGHATWMNSERLLKMCAEREFAGFEVWAAEECGAHNPDIGGLTADVPVLW